MGYCVRPLAYKWVKSTSVSEREEMKGLHTQILYIPTSSYMLQWEFTWCGAWEAGHKLQCSDGSLAHNGHLQLTHAPD